MVDERGECKCPLIHMALPQDMVDGMGWKWQPTCLFTVRSAYEIWTKTESVSTDKIWSTIAKFKGISRVKVFLWLLACDKLLTNSERGNRCARECFVWGVIRDSRGEWKFSFARAVGICSTFEAELWGVIEGLKHAWNLEARSIILKTDNGKVRREVNRLADSMTKMALTYVFAGRKFSTTLTVLIPILLGDSLGISG
ncbi:uncharacterized protein LOC120133946 [Hibiscus syriacus]|uniref:uncharacterized protein LOC120133946 n=1 Tax=Hibiscus syriacus TaxID=106335 RepID=UPI00192297D5|nr:uncharacterized protein LOC120133946 [Hibiscus syriacus]